MRFDLLSRTVCTSTCHLIMSGRQRLTPRLAEFYKMTIKYGQYDGLGGLYLHDDPPNPVQSSKHEIKVILHLNQRHILWLHGNTCEIN